MTLPVPQISGAVSQPAPAIPPSNYLAGIERQTLAQVLEAELSKAQQWWDQCRDNRIIPRELLPQTRAIYDKDDKGRQSKYDPAGKPPQALPQGEPVHEGQFIERVTGHGQSITRPPFQPTPPSVPDGTPSFSLEPPPIQDLLRPGDDSRPFLEQPLPPPPPGEVIAHARLFVIPLVENFDRLVRAQQWDWSQLDVAMTYAAQTKEKWCTSRNVAELRQRYARFDYREKNVTRASYSCLEELEKECINPELDYADKRRRKQAARRQAKRRRKMSKDVKAQTRLKDRQRKKRKNYFCPPA